MGEQVEQFSAIIKLKGGDHLLELASKHGIKFRIEKVYAIFPRKGDMYQFEESGTIRIYVHADRWSAVWIYSDKGRQFWQALIDAEIFKGGPYEKSPEISPEISIIEAKEPRKGSSAARPQTSFELIQLLCTAYLKEFDKNGCSMAEFIRMSWYQFLDKYHKGDLGKKALASDHIKSFKGMGKDKKEKEKSIEEVNEYGLSGTLERSVRYSSFVQWVAKRKEQDKK